MQLLIGKREVPVILSAIFIIIMVITFFFNIPPVSLFATESQRMFVPVVAFASVVGSINLLIFHTQTIRKRRQDWGLSIGVIASFFFFLIIALTPGIESFYSMAYSTIVGRLYEATWALIALFMASMAYRAFRIRNFETFLFTLSCLLVLFGNAPIGEAIWGESTNVLNWIMNVPTMAGMRAITIGLGLGIIAYGIRVLLGYDRAVLGEF